MRFTRSLRDPVKFQRAGNVGIVPLNRPKALNALNHPIVKMMRPQVRLTLTGVPRIQLIQLAENMGRKWNRQPHPLSGRRQSVLGWRLGKRKYFQQN